MEEILSAPYFGIVLSLLVFEISLFIYSKTKLSLLNPLLLSIAFIIFILLFFNIDIEAYNQGGDIISFFLGPATVILAVPLYKKLNLLLDNYKAILSGIIVGSVTAVSSVIFIGRIFGLSEQLILSLVPKSVTTPIAMEVAKEIGGIPSITVSVVIMTGILGAVIGPILCRVLKIKSPIAVGIALGTASHAVGTAKAVELGETEGAMSSLAIGLAGLTTVFITPLLLYLLLI